MVSDVEAILKRAEETAIAQEMDSIGTRAVLSAMLEVRPELLGVLGTEDRNRVKAKISEASEDYARIPGITPAQSTDVRFALFYMDTEKFPVSGEAFAYSLLRQSRHFRRLVEDVGLYPRKIEQRLRAELPVRQQ